MTLPLPQQITALKEMTVAQLRAQYGRLFGEVARSRHKTHLVKRIAWRLQALAEGDLSERARRRAAQLACDADLRLTAPPAQGGEDLPGQASPSYRQRYALPPPGTVLTRSYRGRIIEVTVLTRGFQYEDRLYKSLSAVAKAITGKHWNGYHFFGLWKPTKKVNQP